MFLAVSVCLKSMCVCDHVCMEESDYTQGGERAFDVDVYSCLGSVLLLLYVTAYVQGPVLDSE